MSSNRMAKVLSNLIPGASKLKRAMSNARRFPGSKSYWEQRYAEGGHSGVGSYGEFAEFKADFINTFVAENDLRTVIEFGCGDGNQLTLAEYAIYTGFDVSASAIERCKGLFANDPTKTFHLVDEFAGEQADLALSLDVIFHLVEDDVFEFYMKRLFRSATDYVIIYSSDTDDIGHGTAPHVRHRKFTQWVNQNILDWRLLERRNNIRNYEGDYTKGSFADFFIYRKI